MNDATSSPVGNSITIPPFQSSAALVVRTLNEKTVEAVERLSVTIIGDDDPQGIGSIYPPQAEAKIPDNDIDGYNPHRGCADGSCGPVSLNKQNGEAQIDLFGFHFNSPEPNPVSRFSTPLPSGLGVASQVRGQLTFGNATLGQVTGPTLHYDPTALPLARKSSSPRPSTQRACQPGITR